MITTNPKNINTLAKSAANHSLVMFRTNDSGMNMKHRTVNIAMNETSMLKMFFKNAIRLLLENTKYVETNPSCDKTMENKMSNFILYPKRINPMSPKDDTLVLVLVSTSK